MREAILRNHPRVRPHIADSGHFSRCLVSIVHFDSLLHGLLVCGKRFLPADCYLSYSLEAFGVFFYINKYSDYRATQNELLVLNCLNTVAVTPS